MQLYYEALLELILKKEERRGGSYIHVCEEAETRPSWHVYKPLAIN